MSHCGLTGPEMTSSPREAARYPRSGLNTSLLVTDNHLSPQYSVGTGTCCPDHQAAGLRSADSGFSASHLSPQQQLSPRHELGVGGKINTAPILEGGHVSLNAVGARTSRTRHQSDNTRHSTVGQEGYFPTGRISPYEFIII